MDGRKTRWHFQARPRESVSCRLKQRQTPIWSERHRLNSSMPKTMADDCLVLVVVMLAAAIRIHTLYIPDDLNVNNVHDDVLLLLHVFTNVGQSMREYKKQQHNTTMLVPRAAGCNENVRWCSCLTKGKEETHSPAKHQGVCLDSSLCSFRWQKGIWTLSPWINVFHSKKLLKFCFQLPPR